MPRIVDHSERRQQISGHVARLIASGGMEAATIREIARLSGYSKGIIEHYFDNKEDLISAALEWANARYNRRADEATAGRQGLAAIRARVASTLPLDEEIREEWRIRLIFWSMASIDPMLQRQQAERYQRARERFCGDLKQARRAGEVPVQTRPEAAAERLLFHITGISCAALHNPAHYDTRRLNREMDYLITSLKEATHVR